MVMLCGPKLSLCGVLISIWGVIQLVIMGLLFHMKSVLLIEDIGLEEEFESMKDFYDSADENYVLSAYNCWIAALIYLVTLLISGQQFWYNRHKNAKAKAAATYEL